MKQLSAKIGLKILLEKISAYADSDPGKQSIIALSPSLPEEKRLISFKRLRETKQIQQLLPNLNILKKEKNPEKGTILPGEKILYYRKLLDLSTRTKNILSENEKLEEMATNIDPLPSLKKEIMNFIDENGSVLPSSTPALKSFYKEKISIENRIEKKLSFFLKEKAYLLQDNIITTRLGRTVLPVKYNRKDDIEGIIVDLSRSQNTAFIEPKEVTTLNNRISELENDITVEKTRILRVLTGKISEHFSILEKNTEILTEIDTLKARALYAADFKCIIPEFSEKSILKIKECYHPLLLGEKKQVEPLDLEIGENERILLISGPNAGGKTVLLKNLGINILSSLASIPIPAKEGSKIGSFANISGIIEDEQSIEEKLSSFSSYIVRLKEVLHNADKASLIMLDELGGNTDPVEGSALSIALLNALKEKRSLVIATTHLSPLKFYVEEQDGMINGSMEYENGPTYHLQIGIPGGSRAIAIAEKYGLPQEIINDAKNFIDSEILDAEKLIEELSSRNRNLREREKEITKTKERLAALKKEYEKLMENANKERTKTIKEAEEKANLIIAEARSTVEKTIKDIKEKKASKEAIKKYKKAFSDIPEKRKKTKKETITPSDKNLEIKYDIDLEIPFELSVRGMTRGKAWEATDKFLDKAILAGYNSVRIVHGTGSFILRNMLHKKLKKDKRVRKTDTPPHYEGGEGVTVAFLK
jgi:DNA mismatch repair protein MutS2